MKGLELGTTDILKLNGSVLNCVLHVTSYHLISATLHSILFKTLYISEMGKLHDISSCGAVKASLLGCQCITNLMVQ